MKSRFQTVYRILLIFLILVAALGLWASAQPTNPSPKSASSEVSPGLLKMVEASGLHRLSFGLDQIPGLRERTFFGEPIWKYLAFLLYLFLAFLVAKLIHWITEVLLKRLVGKTETTLDDLLLELLQGPVKVVAFVILLSIGLDFFEWSAKANAYVLKGLIVVVACSLTYLCIKVVHLLLDLWRQRAAHEGDGKFNDQLFSVIRKSLTGFVLVVAVLVTAQNLGINITAAITSLSIGGLAVGLAAQDTLANLFGAIAVFADKPFRVGDQIKLDGAEGKVEEVGLRSTRVRNPEGYLVSVPNKTIGNAIITNITGRPSIKTVMNLALVHDTPTSKVRRALALLEEIYRGNPMTQDVWISFNQFASGNINIMVVHWWKGTDYQRYLTGIQEMNLAVKDRFDAESIRFA